MDKTGFFKQVYTNITYKRWSVCNHGICLKWPLVILYGLLLWSPYNDCDRYNEEGEEGVQYQILNKNDAKFIILKNNR